MEITPDRRADMMAHLVAALILKQNAARPGPGDIEQMVSVADSIVREILTLPDHKAK
jgi:hypothetical protein